MTTYRDLARDLRCGMTARNAESADWCESDGNLTICGTRMIEHHRDSMGVKWCFTCRTRHEFWWVVMVPDGLSYYGPHAEIHGTGRDCRDLFPGWSREWVED